MKRRIQVNYRSAEHRIAWYSGTSDSALRETIKESLGISPESSVVLKDIDGITVAINQYLPDGSRYFAEQRTSQNEVIVDDPKGPQPTTSANSFRGELLKFERINAHLANERTWLAWVRTALSTLSCAFAFLSLTTSGVFKVLTYILGCLFCICVVFVYVTGWMRYTQVKLILGLSFNEM
jgi:hypothetical protein